MKQATNTQQQVKEAYLCINRYGRIISSSASIESLLGFKPDLLTGQSFNDLCLEPNTMAYFNDTMLLKGYVNHLRMCLKDNAGKMLLVDCCASKLQSPDGKRLGTELLLSSLSCAPQQDACPQLKVSMHANVLHANPSAHALLAQWSCQQGQPLPPFLAVDAFQAWATGEVNTREYDTDSTHIYIFVPQAKRALITIHILSKVAWEEQAPHLGEGLEEGLKNEFDSLNLKQEPT